MATAAGVSAMIQFSVRCAVPFLYLAFAASSVHALYPGSLSRWLLRNRVIFGLSFATAMAWQLIFILWLVNIHTVHYINEVYVLRDVIEGVLGYGFLIVMTLTSFKSGRRQLSRKSWKALHKTGIYFLWAYAWSVYWYELYYYSDVQIIDYLYYWLGLSALCLRIAAWFQKQRRESTNNPGLNKPVSLIGCMVIISGFVAASSGSSWSTPAHTFLLDNPLLSFPELYLPYYPFVPFLPVFTIIAGAWLLLRLQPGQND
jgi:hypothetical protein